MDKLKNILSPGHRSDNQNDTDQIANKGLVSGEGTHFPTTGAAEDGLDRTTTAGALDSVSHHTPGAFVSDDVDAATTASVKSGIPGVPQPQSTQEIEKSLSSASKYSEPGVAVVEPTTTMTSKPAQDLSRSTDVQPTSALSSSQDHGASTSTAAPLASHDTSGAYKAEQPLSHQGVTSKDNSGLHDDKLPALATGSAIGASTAALASSQEPPSSTSHAAVSNDGQQSVLAAPETAQPSAVQGAPSIPPTQASSGATTTIDPAGSHNTETAKNLDPNYQGPAYTITPASALPASSALGSTPGHSSLNQDPPTVMPNQGIAASSALDTHTKSTPTQASHVPPSTNSGALAGTSAAGAASETPVPNPAPTTASQQVVSDQSGTQPAQGHGGHGHHDAAVLGTAGAVGAGSGFAAYEASRSHDPKQPSTISQSTLSGSPNNVSNAAATSSAPIVSSSDASAGYEQGRGSSATVAATAPAAITTGYTPEPQHQTQPHDNQAYLGAAAGGAAIGAGGLAAHEYHKNERSNLATTTPTTTQKPAGAPVTTTSNAPTDKDIKQAEKDQAKEVKKVEKEHDKTAKKLQKEHEKDVAKQEKEHDKEIKAIAKEQAKEEKREDQEHRNVAAVLPVGTDAEDRKLEGKQEHEGQDVEGSEKKPSLVHRILHPHENKEARQEEQIATEPDRHQHGKHEAVIADDRELGEHRREEDAQRDLKSKDPEAGEKKPGLVQRLLHRHDDEKETHHVDEQPQEQHLQDPDSGRNLHPSVPPEMSNKTTHAAYDTTEGHNKLHKKGLVVDKDGLSSDTT